MEGATGRTCSVRHLHSPLTFAFSWRTDKQSPRVVHAVTATCLQCKFLLQLQRWQAEEPRVVHVTTTTRIHCNWGGICRVDIPAAGRAFCDSDLRAVMHVSLALLICHDRWKGHYNYMQHIQSIWQRSTMGQLRWNLPSRHTGGGSRILWQWPTGRYACFSGFLDMPRSLKRSPQLHATHSIDMAA